jgi:hypothetical protein
MHLLEAYSLNCGAAINKPYIYELFCPIPYEKYITFHTDTKFPSKNYDLWQSVIDTIRPVLERHEIKIIQTGTPESRLINNVVDYRGKINVNQLAFLIKGSILHFGSDDFQIHLASHYNKLIVGLFNITRPENTGPYFGDKNKQILFKCYERLGLKPSHAPEENPKTINSINPEEIAEAILKLLSLESKILYKTSFIGERYGKTQIHDLIPNQIVGAAKESLLDMRMDQEFNENALAQQLQNNRCRIFTDKRINIDLLKNFKQNVDTLFYFVSENDDPVFVKQVSELGIKITILSKMSESAIAAKKIHYYEYGNINTAPAPKKELIEKLKSTKNLYYKSCQSVYSNNKIYSSFAAKKLDKPRIGEFEPVIDSQDFWEDLDNFFFVEMIDKE